MANKSLEIVGIFKGKNGNTVAKLIELNEASAEEIISEMDKNGLRPATLEELLVLTASCPELLS